MIEKYDKLRYHILLVYTISWLVLFGIYTILEYLPSKTLKIIFIPFLLTATVVGCIYSIKMRNMTTKINRDKKLKEALSNEMYKQNILKSCTVGYVITIAIVILLFLITIFYPLSGILVCKLAIYFGVGSALVAALIYNKE